MNESQSIVAIFPASMLILWVGLWLLKLAGKRFTRRVLLYILIGGVILTAMSLLNQVSRYSGTNLLTAYGWPHEFFIQQTSTDGAYQGTRTHISWGPLGSYVWTNIIFYFSVLVLVIGARQYFRRRITK